MINMKFGRMAVLHGRNFAKEFPEFKVYFERQRKIKDKASLLRAACALIGAESSPGDLKRGEFIDTGGDAEEQGRSSGLSESRPSIGAPGIKFDLNSTIEPLKT